ncbi:kinase [Lithospermum erythrorhizon]|uniref:Kinase n=1 Tax=Lithospermum erythrorhizon TaxID=34254 RepID=A0AAV3Q299_LITER
MAVKTNGCVDGNLPHELTDLLVTLASNWGDVIEVSGIKVEHLKGAMTNEVYRISWPIENEESSRNVLVRLYGQGVELFFDRDEEIKTFQCMSRLGFGPRLLGQFSEGRVEQFIHARTLSADDLHETEISALIAAKVREFHQLDMPGPRNVVLWDRLRTFLSEAKEICSAEHMKEFRLDELDDEIKRLENEFPEEQEIAFCHNDLQYGNIMIDDKTRSLTLIDYEYASYNPVAYDFANHFCEMAANYHTETPHVLDYNKYPGLEERHRYIHAYLSYAGHEADESEIGKMSEEAEKYSLASHIFWGLWGIISAYVNSIEFDYMEYARQRFEQYWLKKNQLLGVKHQ